MQISRHTIFATEDTRYEVKISDGDTGALGDYLPITPNRFGQK